MINVILSIQFNMTIIAQTLLLFVYALNVACQMMPGCLGLNGATLAYPATVLFSVSGIVDLALVWIDVFSSIFWVAISPFLRTAASTFWVSQVLFSSSYSRAFNVGIIPFCGTLSIFLFEFWAGMSSRSTRGITTCLAIWMKAICATTISGEKFRGGWKRLVAFRTNFDFGQWQQSFFQYKTPCPCICQVC